MNDLTNQEQGVSDYTKEVLRREFPNVDLRDDGEFMETFALPFIKLMTPIFVYMDRMKLMQSPENAAELTIEEMDKVAAREYVYRNLGRRSAGYVVFVFNDIPKSGTLLMPAGIQARTSSGLLFISTESLTLGLEDLVEFYDPSSYEYRIPVAFQSLDTGKRFDVKAGEIVSIDQAMDKLSYVTNESAFAGGVDMETNVQLAQRMTEEAMAPNLGIEQGYIRFLRSFPSVTDVEIAGYRHPLMKRDVIGLFEYPGAFQQTVSREIHWGTKIDAYVRGRTLEEVTEFLEVFETDEGEKYVIFNQKPVFDIINVSFYSSTGEYDNPSIDPDSLYINQFSIQKEEDFESEGTLDEGARLFVYDERVEVGRFLRVRYRYNALIREINDSMYEDDNRPPTADVKIKEAHRKFLTGSLVVKMNSTFGVRERERNVLKQRIGLWLEEKPLGEEFQFSDINTPISEPTVFDTNEDLVDYIHHPSQFLILKNNDRYIFYCASEEQRRTLDYMESEHPFLFSLYERYKDEIKTKDFFDLLHVLMYKGGFSEVADKISFEGYEEGLMVEIVYKLREITAKSSIIQDLSPAKRDMERNEFLEVGELFAYEAKDYSQAEWKRFIYLFRNLAAGSDVDTDGLKEMYELTMFVLSFIYIVIQNPATVEDRKKMYWKMRDLFERTVIEADMEG